MNCMVFWKLIVLQNHNSFYDIRHEELKLSKNLVVRYFQ